MKGLLIMSAIAAFAAQAGETWIDPGVGQSSVVDQAQADGFANGAVVVASGSNVFANVSLDVADIQVGTNDTANAAVLELAGGALNVTGAMRVGARCGDEEGAEGVLRVTGGQHVFQEAFVADAPYSRAKVVLDGPADTMVTVVGPDVQSPTVACPRGGAAEVEIRSGTFYTPSFLQIASYDTTLRIPGRGRFSVYEGGTLKSDKSLYVGGMANNLSGTGELNVYGGAVQAYTIYMAHGVNPVGGTCYLRQYGGLLDLTYDVHLPASNARTAEYHLYGGRVKARWIFTGSTTGTGIFKADGGVFQPKMETKTDETAVLRALAVAALGRKGLTIDTTYLPTRINQSFTDLDDAAGEGLLVKVGVAALTIGNDSTAHAKTVVAQGPLVFAAPTTTWTALAVTNGATLSTVGDCASLTLRALTLGDAEKGARLLVDPSDAISVDAPVSIPGSLAFAFGTAPTVGAYDVLSCAGVVDAETAFNWRMASVTGIPAGTHAKLSSAYDAGSNRTVFSVAVLDGDEPAAEPIQVASGAEEISDELDLGPSKRVIEVAKDASLVVSGSAGGAGFVKQGGGRLCFTSPINRFNGGFELDGGLLGFTSMTGTGFGGTDSFLFRDGTLQLSSDEPEGFFPYKICLRAPVEHRALVIKADSDIVFKALDYAYPNGRGAIVKRGVGRLTFETAVTEQRMGAYGGEKSGTELTTNAVVFDANGTAPTNGFRHLQVAEGEMRLTARGAGSFLMGAGQHFGIGMNTPNGTAAPALTVDGCQMDAPDGNNRFLYVGDFADANAFWSDATFNVTNGGVFNAHAIFGPDDRVEKAITAHVNVSAGSVLHASGRLAMGYCDPGRAMTKNPLKRAEYRVTGGSRLSARVFEVGGPTSVTLDGGSVLAGGADREPAQIDFLWERNPCGEFRFQGHSTLCMSTNFTFFVGLSPFGFVFDDGVWETGSEPDLLLAFKEVRFWDMKVLNGGLEMPVAEGRTVTLARDLTGTGALVKSGAGTLVMRTKMNNGKEVDTDKQTLCCAGGACVTGGVLKVQAEAVQEGLPMFVGVDGVLDLDGSEQAFSSVAGAGTIRNGSLPQLTIRAGSSLTLDNVTWPTASRVLVDFGKTAEDPLVKPFPQNVRVATLVGSTPRNVSKWRVANTGLRGVKGTFTLVGNDVMMSVDYSGVAVIVR